MDIAQRSLLHISRTDTYVMSAYIGTIQESNWDNVLYKIEEKQKSLQYSKLTKYMLQGKAYGCSIGYTYQNYPLHQFHYDHYSHCIKYTCRTGYESIWGTQKLYSVEEIDNFLDNKLNTSFKTLQNHSLRHLQPP